MQECIVYISNNVLAHIIGSPRCLGILSKTFSASRLLVLVLVDSRLIEIVNQTSAY
jgi:hypothetical protein